MMKREQWCLAMIIDDFISKTLTICFGTKSRKLMMEKALSIVKVCDDLLDYILLTNTAIA
jgi:hypothetical protein